MSTSENVTEVALPATVVDAAATPFVLSVYVISTLEAYVESTFAVTSTVAKSAPYAPITGAETLSVEGMNFL